MPVSDQRLKIAVFIDFDNIEIGVKTTLNATFDVGAVLDAIKERGEVVTKVAYGDWKRAGEHSRALTQQAIRMVQRNMTPGGDKNGADINLALDALEMALTHQHINAYVIVGGDSDFISLVEKLKQYDKTVFVVGGRAFTSVILQKNCHEFIAYENVIAPQGGGRRAPEKGRPASQAPIKQAFQLVRRALKVLTDREVSPQLGLLKSTLLQLDSSFSERDYGVSSFRDFAEKLAESGFVRLNQQGRSVLVELKDGDHEGIADVEPSPSVSAPAPAPAEHVASAAEPAAVAETSLGQPADAVRAIREMFEAAPATMRWPMYVRNVKQYARSVDSTFDERRYGFAGILDLLRACQREGVFRLERDRKGVLRVFPGVLIQRVSAAAPGLAPQDAEILSTPDRVGAAAAEVPGPGTELHLPPSGVEPADAAVEAATSPATPDAVVDEAPAEEKPARRRRAAGAPRKPAARAKATAPRPRPRKKNPA
jgi:uncharacterized LabA/DUF88 family protein